MASETQGTPEARRRKARLYAQSWGLTRDDRISLAETLLWRDVDSWKSLTDAEVSRLLDALEGAALIQHLVRLHQP